MERSGVRTAIATVLLLLLRCRSVVVRVNVGYFREPAGHLWTYGVDAHSWTDGVTNTTYSYVYWPQTSGAKIVKKMQSGELDLSHSGNAPWANGITRGVKGKLIYIIHSKDESQVLVSHRGIRTPQELLGKRVAYVSGSTTHYMLEGLAEQARLDMRTTEEVALLSEEEREQVVTILPMSQAEQMDAWGRGEIDAGFMWGNGMRHLQENPWCDTPDVSSSLFRPCDAEGAGQPGYDLFTAGVSKRWDRETWNCLAVTDAFAAAHARAVYRFVKVISTMDTQLVEDKSFFTQSEARLCTLAKTASLECDISGMGFVQRSLSFDLWLDAPTQQSSDYLGERAPGQCDLEFLGEYPNFDGPCNKLTMAGTAWSTWATADFAYKLKQLPFLPSFKYYQDTLDIRYINDVGSVDEMFPEITVDSLALLPDVQESSSAATNFCGEMVQPIALDLPGVVSDHEGIGHYQEVSCVWQISQPTAVLISDINVRIERAQDTFLVYEGICSGDDCTDFPLVAKYTGGKGTSALTVENLNPRPPVWISTGQATVRFVPDGTADVPLLVTVDDGISFRWDRADSSSGQCSGITCMNGGTCADGACQCVDGWSGADCSFPSCIGTKRLIADEASTTFQSNVDGERIGYDADCRWIITAEDQSKVVALEFLELDSDWLYDVITVYAGDSMTETLAVYSGFESPMLAREVGHKCPGDKCPGLLLSPGSSVLVRLTSNSIESGSGFRIGYRSVAPDEARCGTGDFANCSGNGNCADTGCACNDGWFGDFCQSKECLGSTVLPTVATGFVRNAAEDVANYAPNLDCHWVVTAPLRDDESAGGIAFWFRSFIVEADERSTDMLLLAGAGMEGLQFTGASQPCINDAACTCDSDCSGGSCVYDNASCQATGDANTNDSGCLRTCSCPATIILGDEATLEFITDFNNYPPTSSFTGFVLEYEALYDCLRNASTGQCVALDRCTELEKEAGDLGCQDCPSNMYYDKAFQTCRCESGFYPGEEGEERCMPCQLGTFSQDRGSLECVKCPPGFFGGTTGLTQCSRCPLGTYSNQSGASECAKCPGSLTTQYLGSYEVEFCVCDEDTYRPANDRLTCLECPTRMVCAFGADELNFGNANATEGRVAPEVEEAFFAEADYPLSVYRCRNTLECPGGPPGTCQTNRMGLGCGMCEPWFVPSKQDGGCKPCGVGGIAPGIVAILLAIFAMSGLVVFSRVDVSQTKLNTLTVAIIVGQLVVTAQFLSLFNSLSVTWVEPVRSFMAFLSLLSFDLEVLNLGCTVPEENHALVFLLKLLIFPLLALLLLFLAYIMSCWERRPFEIHRLINSIGLLFMTLYLTLSMVAVEPFQCTSSPNGTHSITSQPAVLCGGNQEYIWTAAVGVVAVLGYPVGFFSWVSYICYHYPQMISSGNGHIIINRYRFLFQRFRADCFYYAPVYLLRNFLIALLPALYPDHGHRQIIGFVFLLLVFGNIQGWLRPWRGVGANMLDSVITVCIVMVLLGGALLIDSEASQVSSDLQFFLAAVLTVMGISFVGIFVYLMYLRFFPKKTYLAFLSHHKQGCGAGARLMKIELEGRTGKHVFLDSDELESLENLFDIVRLNTGKLVLLLTAETLSRPWCAGEIACAWKNNVPIICVHYDDYVEPTDEELTLDGLRSKWSAEAFAEVELQGIFLTDVQEAFTNIRSSEKIHMPRLACSLSGELAELEKAVADVIAKVDGKPPSVATTHTSNESFQETETVNSAETNKGGGDDEGHIVVLANGDNGEAISTAQVLARMLQKVTQQTAVEVVNHREMEVAKAKENHVTHLLVVLSPGALSATAFSRILIAAFKQWPRALVTTVKCMDFCFPSKAELEQLIFTQVAQETQTNIEVVRSSYNTVLACLAMPFSPHGHISVLTAEVERISRRLESRAKARQVSPPATSGAMLRSSTRAWSMSTMSRRPTSRETSPMDPQVASLSPLDQEPTLYQAHSTSSALAPETQDNASGTSSKEAAGQAAHSGSEAQGDGVQDAMSATPSATHSKESADQAGHIISDAARASEGQASYSVSSGPQVRGELWQEPNSGSAEQASGGQSEWQAADSGSAPPNSTGLSQWQAANSGGAVPESPGPSQWQAAGSGGAAPESTGSSQWQAVGSGGAVPESTGSSQWQAVGSGGAVPESTGSSQWQEARSATPKSSANASQDEKEESFHVSADPLENGAHWQDAQGPPLECQAPVQ